MKFNNQNADIYIPDQSEITSAVKRTTTLVIGAHQDDIEIMASHAVVECMQNDTKWFTGVVVSNGSGSPRSGVYKNYTDDDMIKIRKIEQKKAAYLGQYSALIQLDYPSSIIKIPKSKNVIDDIKTILEASSPQIVYTHNLLDKHDTHVATSLCVIEAIRQLDNKPQKLLGCEVWRNLDWLPNSKKVILNCSKHKNLQTSLLGVFDSQIAGGKRYDLATIGRRQANATFFESHQTDEMDLITFAMDLSPLITDVSKDIFEFIDGLIAEFSSDIKNKLHNFI